MPTLPVSILLLCSLIGSVMMVPTKNQKTIYGKDKDPEEHLDTVGVIYHWGYVPETHKVETSDGYILTMHRIPNGKDQKPTPNKPVIFLQHGLESSSQDWVANLPWESAGFYFADQGFDVWMGNFRGNTYSRAHINLDPDTNDEFWAFSYDQMALIDLPAMIDYVTKSTGQQQIAYAGHSEGTMTAFIQFSTNQTIASKISHFFALAPIGEVGHIGGLLKYVAPFTNEIEILFDLLGGHGEFLPSSGFLHAVEQFVCGLWITDPLCDEVMFLLCGPDTHQINETRTAVYTAHAPAGTSTQNIVHFGQNVNSGKFQMYDYGKRENQKHYGQEEPPVHDLSTMKVPTYLFCGDKDILADPTDVNYLVKVLPNVVQKIDVVDTNHLDFVWGLNAIGQVYMPIVQILKG